MAKIHPAWQDGPLEVPYAVDAVRLVLRVETLLAPSFEKQLICPSSTSQALHVHHWALSVSIIASRVVFHLDRDDVKLFLTLVKLRDLGARDLEECDREATTLRGLDRQAGDFLRVHLCNLALEENRGRMREDPPPSP
eukprot:CAMPEP_0167775978 /NCGR_PEP_ID=MMETSP0111_2-20121227/2866_1 /TAXON_ID=91324 /ORGANISM="Lotharella globosa, Strain CCCM811" /LENGTH=137 /DNA_ID=CAMNT_0007665967 /DNA_START=215 /DNA_END=628 /DNA_ORIENTATION=+